MATIALPCSCGVPPPDPEPPGPPEDKPPEKKPPEYNPPTIKWPGSPDPIFPGAPSIPFP